MTDSAQQSASINTASKPTFKSRKRPTKKRKRTTDTESQRIDDDNQDGGNGVKTAIENESRGPTTAELLLMKQAQTLRQRSRSTGLDISLTSAHPESNSTNMTLPTEQGDDNKVNEIADGLKSNFSIEKSGNAVEERMSKYIEDGMRKKFGDAPKPTANANISNRNSFDTDNYNDVSDKQNSKDDVDEDSQKKENEKNSYGEEDNTVHKDEDIFAIPSRLKMKDKPLYDPSEGMPSAGLEETEISRHRQPEKRKVKPTSLSVLPPLNQQAGNKLDRKKRKSNPVANDITSTLRGFCTSTLPGNFSANFELHRQEWNSNFLSRSTHLSTQKDNKIQGTGSRRQSSYMDAEGKRIGSNSGSLETRNRTDSGNNSGLRRHNHSDAAFADRYRKKWKK